MEIGENVDVARTTQYVTVFLSLFYPIFLSPASPFGSQDKHLQMKANRGFTALMYASVWGRTAIAHALVTADTSVEHLNLKVRSQHCAWTGWEGREWRCVYIPPIGQ